MLCSLLERVTCLTVVCIVAVGRPERSGLLPHHHLSPLFRALYRIDSHIILTSLRIFPTSYTVRRHISPIPLSPLSQLVTLRQRKGFLFSARRCNDATHPSSSRTLLFTFSAASALQKQTRSGAACARESGLYQWQPLCNHVGFSEGRC